MPAPLFAKDVLGATDGNVVLLSPNAGLLAIVCEDTPNGLAPAPNMLLVFFSPPSAGFGANGEGADPDDAKGFDGAGVSDVVEAEAKGLLAVLDC